MRDEKDETQATLLAPLRNGQLFGAGFIGLIVGLIVWALGSLIDQYVLQVLFCQDTASACQETKVYAVAIGAILGAGLGLFGLVKLRVLRPLLVVAASMAGLWNLMASLSEAPLYGIIISHALLYAGLYMLLTWLARLRSMYVVLLLFIVVVVALRFALTT